MNAILFLLPLAVLLGAVFAVLFVVAASKRPVRRPGRPAGAHAEGLSAGAMRRCPGTAAARTADVRARMAVSGTSLYLGTDLNHPDGTRRPCSCSAYIT
jgi:hypothetical protein